MGASLPPVKNTRVNLPNNARRRNAGAGHSNSSALIQATFLGLRVRLAGVAGMLYLEDDLACEMLSRVPLQRTIRPCILAMGIVYTFVSEQVITL